MRRRKKHILLVEPNYYTRFPPLGLLKLSTYHKNLGDTTEYVRGEVKPKKRPNLIYVTSLFTWAWKPVHSAVKFYKKLFPHVKIILGGIYASLMLEHAKKSGADKIHIGLFHKAENLMPDYDLIPEWDGSIIFSSRGCIRQCKFCAVPKLEGKPHNLKYSIKHLVHQKHKRIIFWDNNILACNNWREIFDELIELDLKVDFNQGIDARLITDEVAEKLKKMKFDLLRLAYDNIALRICVKKAIDILDKHGISKRKIIVYTLFNYEDDSPEDFWLRVKDLLTWGVCSYPMRYQPLDSLEKNIYISPKWSKEEVNMVQTARRVLGIAGTFPPYKGLVKKIQKARNFYEAFSLYPLSDKKVRPLEKLSNKNYIHNVTHRWGGDLDWRSGIISPKKNIELKETL
jgi:hypothetical protein